MTKIVVEAVRKIQGPINRATLVNSLMGLRDYDSGIIAPVSYSPERLMGASAIQRVVARGGKWVAVGSPVDSEKGW